MALSVEICKKQCFKAKWQVVVPPSGRTVENLISLKTHQWTLRFTTTFWDKFWILSFVKSCKNSVSPSFLLTVCVRSKDGRNMPLFCEEITGTETTVFQEKPVEFLRKYPDVYSSQNTLKFIFTFDYEVQSFQACQQEHKSVQTSGHEYHSLQNLSLDLLKLMDGGPDPDVRLKCGDCTIPAHRFILCARSEVFRAMLQSDMLEGREGSVEIVDMEPEVFQIFIRYLYTGLLPELSEDIALSLYETGDKYHVNALRCQCSDFLAKNLTREMACEVLATADAHSDKDLKARAISYILDKKIPASDDVWSEFCESHPKLAIEVYSRAYKQFVCSE